MHNSLLRQKTKHKTNENEQKMSIRKKLENTLLHLSAF